MRSTAVRAPRPSLVRGAAWALVLLVGWAVPGRADDIPPPIVFEPGTPARAADVNANFEAIRTVVNGHLDGNNIRDGSIDTVDLASGAVNSFVLADGSVT